MPNNLTEPEQELAQLQAQLNEAAAAEHFFETASGKLFIELINRRVNTSLKKLTSDAYLKDHTGYVNELAWLNANKRFLRELQVASSPQRKAKLQERVDVATEVVKDARTNRTDG